jgi:hypothetical protein
MKTSARRWIGLGLLCSVLLFAGTLANGQQPTVARAIIPFPFWIGDNPLPAGDYEIQHVISSTLVLFRSTNGATTQDAYMIPLDDSPVKPNQAKLIFRIQDGRHYLYALWGVYGKRVLTAESARPAPAIDSLIEVHVAYR